MSAIRYMFLTAPVLLSGCAVFTPPVEVSRRYDRVEPARAVCDDKAGTNAKYCYEATISALPASSSETELSISALSDRGQEAYVLSLAALSKDPASLRAAMATPLKTSASAVADYQDKSQLKLRFVLGLAPSNGYLYPGDRLEWAKVTIQPLGPSGSAARFTGWTQAANAFETIDVGSVTSTRSETLSGETGLKIAKFAPDTKVAAEFSSSTEEKADIKDRVTISAMIREGAATIIQTGGWRRDLTGNATFDATIILPPGDTTLMDFTTASDYAAKTAAGAPGAPNSTRAADMTIGQRYVRVAKAAAFCADVTLEFVARHIVSGDRSFSESNDRIQAIRGKTSGTQNVAQIMGPDRWVISRVMTYKGVTGPVLLQFSGDDGSSQPLAFASKGEALAFVRWMAAAGVTGRVKNGTLSFVNGQPIANSAYSEMDAMNELAGRNWQAMTKSCPTPAPAPRPLPAAN